MTYCIRLWKESSILATYLLYLSTNYFYFNIQDNSSEEEEKGVRVRVWLKLQTCKPHSNQSQKKKTLGKCSEVFSK